MNIVEACQVVGIARSTYYYFVSTHPGAIAPIQEMQMVAALEQFALAL
jgi:ACT domain-containing protein